MKKDIAIEPENLKPGGFKTELSLADMMLKNADVKRRIKQEEIAKENARLDGIIERVRSDKNLMKRLGRGSLGNQ